MADWDHLVQQAGLLGNHHAVQHPEQKWRAGWIDLAGIAEMLKSQRCSTTTRTISLQNGGSSRKLSAEGESHLRALTRTTRTTN